MAELITRTDLEGVRRELDTPIKTVRRDLKGAIVRGRSGSWSGSEV